MRRSAPSYLLLPLLAALIALAWYLPNRPQNPAGGATGVTPEKFSALSFAAYRPGQSPLTNSFPTEAEADADMALVATVAKSVRTYAAHEGNFETAALAQKHGVGLWQGIWLSANRADNEREITAGIALARKYPQTITRVVVGNEVLLRRDLPVAELIADIDRIKVAVKQPVAYADVWEFWLQFPQVAPHVDLMLIHLLPYWEDIPTGIDRAVQHVGDIYQRIHTAFPGKTIAIGETGWPSAGRARADAVPSRVNETIFLRRFLALATAEHFDYNFIEAFDQDWKYESEGIVGASWGIFDSARHIKIPLSGPVSNDPAWPAHAAISIAAGLLLAALWRARSSRAENRAALDTASMILGAALGFAAATAWSSLYDGHLILAAAVNLPAQTLLAALAILRLCGAIAADPTRSGAATTEMVHALLSRGRLPALHGLFEDVMFLFLWTAAVMQMLLFCDSRYREFPLSTFAVPLLVTAAQIAARSPRPALGREDAIAAAILGLAAIGNAALEGPLNSQSLAWNACALVLAAPILLQVKQVRLGGAKPLPPNPPALL
jgi:exo-beta-1,3-glucanase (GH17 family)